VRRPLTAFWEVVQSVKLEIGDEGKLEKLPSVVGGMNRNAVAAQMAELTKSYAKRHHIENPLQAFEYLSPDIKEKLQSK
jgi:hypothetical protein